MHESARYSGLCETCEYDATCTLRRCSQLRIVQCEEFSVGRASQPPARANAVASDLTGASSFGLCINCLYMATCGFPDARRGVVACEEYTVDDSGSVGPVTSRRSRSAA